jgi:hypothetical protein
MEFLFGEVNAKLGREFSNRQLGMIVYMKTAVIMALE